PQDVPPAIGRRDVRPSPAGRLLGSVTHNLLPPVTAVCDGQGARRAEGGREGELPSSLPARLPHSDLHGWVLREAGRHAGQRPEPPAEGTPKGGAVASLAVCAGGRRHFAPVPP